MDDTVGIPSLEFTSRKRHYFLRWRILARMRRFFRPSFRLPLPLFFTPTKWFLNQNFFEAELKTMPSRSR